MATLPLDGLTIRSDGRKKVSATSGIYNPRQLGPINGKSASSAISAIVFWSSRFPVSANPPDITAAPPTPDSIHSLSIFGQNSALAEITARSTGSGISEILVYTLCP